MQTIKDLINEIKWDPKRNPKDYVLIYIDFGKEKEIPYTAIKRLEGNFMVLQREGTRPSASEGDSSLEEVEIPLHRIRKVKKQGKLIWQRKIIKK
ncbi:DUF504 domain-containing protein [Candidatus Woesearchaeota archaeon]|nr:DUF504 domain-containing protein [Candidatus Woesearchaeota archaeon]